MGISTFPGSGLTGPIGWGGPSVTSGATGPSLIAMSSVLTRHTDEFRYAMTQNWDGRGATAITPGVVNLATSILSRYADECEPSEVTPGRDGSLSFVWDDANNYVYVDIGPNDTVHLYYDVMGEPKWEAVSTAADEEMLQRFARALSFARPVRNAIMPTISIGGGFTPSMPPLAA